MTEEIVELPSSELGTKEYWERNYEDEIRNYKANGDVGEVWFDEDSQLRIISWILKNEAISLERSIIDLGCGNGMFLIDLAREGFQNLTGIDYSPKAIELSKNIAKDQHLKIEYVVKDLLSFNNVTNFGPFDIVHDKGTYDAISLHPDNPQEKREIYLQNVHSIQKPDGYFIITSCNWTEEELITAFAGKFVKFHLIPTPTFKFGGKIGNVVTSIVFKKKLDS